MNAQPLPSAADGQWTQWTYGVLPTGNWNLDNQSLCVLDNGDVWMIMVRQSDHVSQMRELDEFWIGKVTPEGCIRYSADVWSLGNGVNIYDYPTTAGGFINEEPVAGQNRGNFMLTDGTLIYYWNAWNLRWFSIDPDTLRIEWIAGSGPPGRGTTDFLNDSHDGKLASFDHPQFPTFHDGWMYFTDQVLRFSGNSDIRGKLRTIRRMQLSGEHPVETLTPEFNNPVSLGPNPNLFTPAWFGEINPATGLVNALNEDVLFTTDDVATAVWKDHLYLCASSGNGSSSMRSAWVRRWPLAGGPIETLYYALDAESWLYSGRPNSPRELISDFEETPNGTYQTAGNYWNPYTLRKGTPELEGFLPTNQNMVVLDDGSLMIANWASSTPSAGNQYYGVTIVKFDLDRLIADTRTGPIRHNRAAPYYQTVVNGTSPAESASSYNDHSGFGGWRYSAWNARDGSNPLISHPLTPSLATNSKSSWAGKLLYIHSVLGSFTNFTDWDTDNNMFVAVLERPEADTNVFNVELSFEGIALKGYGEAHDLTSPSAPEEVVLS